MMYYSYFYEQKLRRKLFPLKKMQLIALMPPCPALQLPLSSQVKSSQVTFIYIVLLTIQIVSKQLHSPHKHLAHIYLGLPFKHCYMLELF